MRRDGAVSLHVSAQVDPELAAILERFDAASDDPLARAAASRELGLYSERRTAAEVDRPVLYAPQDVDWSHARWGANCGPGALAAVLGVDVAAVREGFPQFPAKPWTTFTAMKSALRGVSTATYLSQTFPCPSKRGLDGGHTLALVMVQWLGPWTEPGVNGKWAFRHTHWVGVASKKRDPRSDPRFAPEPRYWVYDVNADHTTRSGDPRLSVLSAGGGGWVRLEDWQKFIVPVFLASTPTETKPQATGWCARYAIEVFR